MKYVSELQEARFIRRYKRFLADVELSDGTMTTIYCPNTGAMHNCLVPGSSCWYSVSDNQKRKYSLTWEIATTKDGSLAAIHSAKANALVKEAINNGTVTELQGYLSIQSEVKYGQSRIDFLLEHPSRPPCYVEVKSVTLGVGNGQGLFPDAISARGTKHLQELIGIVEQGYRGVLLYAVQHTGITSVSPADDIDPVYGQVLRQAQASGVEIYAYGAAVSPSELVLQAPLPVVL